MTGSTCRSCGATLNQTFVDLGETPLANSYPGAAELDRPDRRYPLHARVCQDCFLVQVDAVVPSEEIFSDYAYFSSYSESWVDHARRFTEIARRRFALDGQSLVVEVASNDGYLLRHFVEAGVPVLGVEPAANVAVVAEAAGVPTAVRFFGRKTAAVLVADGKAADLVVGNNVLAHVPDLNDFVADADFSPAREYVLLVFDGIGVVGHAAAWLHAEAAHREVGPFVRTDEHLARGACAGGDFFGGDFAGAFDDHDVVSC